MQSLLRKYLRQWADAEVARQSARFFKTAKGEYAEGDRFLGIRVPAIRKAVRHFKQADQQAVLALLESEYHEERLFALLWMVAAFTVADTPGQKWFYNYYMTHTAYVNNWDLIDSSASVIVGQYLEKRSRKPIYRLARSANWWERRIAVMATFYYIRQNDFDDTLKLAELLLGDTMDLIHKASGWMLREIGNRNRAVASGFLNKHASRMPRVMLRYAIEKYPEKERKNYLAR